LEARKKYSVEQLINRAHWLITYPSTLLSIGIWLNIYFAFRDTDASMWLLFFIIPGSVLPSLMYAGMATNQWRIWAFTLTDDVHELERRAIEDKIIYPESSIFRHLEIWLGNSRNDWQSITKRFNETKQGTVGNVLPEEYCVYFDKRSLFSALVLMLAVLLLSIYVAFFVISENQGRILLLVLYGIFFAVFIVPTYMKTQTVAPQIVMNTRGISTCQTPFYTWDQVSEERAEYLWKEGRSCLHFHCPQGHIKIPLRDLSTDLKTLNYNMKVYRARFESATT
jgi:hypothetical protein